MQTISSNRGNRLIELTYRYELEWFEFTHNYLLFANLRYYCNRSEFNHRGDDAVLQYFLHVFVSFKTTCDEQKPTSHPCNEFSYCSNSEGHLNDVWRDSHAHVLSNIHSSRRSSRWLHISHCKVRPIRIGFAHRINSQIRTY